MFGAISKISAIESSLSLALSTSFTIILTGIMEDMIDGMIEITDVSRADTIDEVAFLCEVIAAVDVC